MFRTIYKAQNEIRTGVAKFLFFTRKLPNVVDVIMCALLPKSALFRATVH